jgi:microcystin degradation protein MlrC
MSPATAVKTVLETADFPTVLLDMGDNVGGGSSADGTILLNELHQRRASHSFVCLYDQEAVKQSIQAGVDAVVHLSIGGKTDSIHGEPFTGSFRVLSLQEGTFSETQARHGGFKDYDQGPTAIIETTDTNLTVMLTSKRVPPFSLSQITAFGLNPKQFDIIVAKGVIAPLAAYRPIANAFLFVDTPGVTRADMRQLDYHHRRKPMFPFERDG